MGRATNFTFFGLFIGSYLLFILALSCPWWYESGNTSYGLFKECYRDSYGAGWQCSYLDYGETRGEVIGAMALMVIALLVNTTALVMCVLVIVGEFSVTISAILCGVGGVAQLVAVGIFGSVFNGDTLRIGWSFALACCSMAAQILTTVGIIVADRVC